MSKTHTSVYWKTKNGTVKENQRLHEDSLAVLDLAAKTLGKSRADILDDALSCWYREVGSKEIKEKIDFRKGMKSFLS